MTIAVVTGSAGLIGSAAARFYVDLGMDVVGIDDDSRARYFGPGASTAETRDRLVRELGHRYHHVDMDVRDRAGIVTLYRRYGERVELTVHAAAQPSHDWSAGDPFHDFEVNATATVSLLDAHRNYAGRAPFVFLSTNKVYGDLGAVDVVEQPTRLVATGRWRDGIDETYPLDQTTHSPFGCSKLAADVMVQEFGRYYGLPTVCFRGGTLTGGAHRGAELHGFLAYLVDCCRRGHPYTVIGHGGKQVRDVIHADDVVSAIEWFRRRPRPGAVYNLGGGQANAVSVFEAIEMAEHVTGRAMKWSYEPRPRIGDHRWYVSKLDRIRRDYPEWDVARGLPSILEEIAAAH